MAVPYLCQGEFIAQAYLNLPQTQRTFARACSLVLSTSGDFGVPSNNCWEADGWSNYWRGFGMLLIGWISSCFISSYPHRLKICSISTGCTINQSDKQITIWNLAISFRSTNIQHHNFKRPSKNWDFPKQCCEKPTSWSRSKIILIGPEIYTNLLQRMVQLDVTGAWSRKSEAPQ